MWHFLMRQKYFILNKIGINRCSFDVFCAQNKKVEKLFEKCLVNQSLYLILQSDLNKTLKHVKL